MPLVGLYKVTGELVLIISTVLASEVIFVVGKKEFSYLMCELGGQSNFEVLGEL